MNRTVRVRTTASGVNRADLLQLAGDYAPPPGESAVPGLECAGVVLEDSGGTWPTGTPVAALLGSGGYGDEVDVDPEMLLDAAGIDPVQAAVLPEALGTAWWNLVALARVQHGETVLVTGANSGVGHLAIQTARHLGLRPIAAVRGTAWTDALTQLGAEAVIDTTDPCARDALAAACPEGIDVAVDLVGSAVAPLVQGSLGRGGRWLIVGLLGGASAELDLRGVIRRRLWVTGSSLRSLSPEERRHVVAGVRDDVWDGVRSGTIRAHIAASFPVADVARAHARLGAGGVLGKLVLIHPRNPEETAP